MESRIIVLVLLLGLAVGVSCNNIMEMVEGFTNEKITNPDLAKFMKLFCVQGCITNMARMNPDVLVKAMEVYMPHLNACYERATAVDAPLNPSAFKTCMVGAQEKIKASVEMSEEDSKIFDEGMCCISTAIGM